MMTHKLLRFVVLLITLSIPTVQGLYRIHPTECKAKDLCVRARVSVDEVKKILDQVSQRLQHDVREKYPPTGTALYDYLSVKDDDIKLREDSYEIIVAADLQVYVGDEHFVLETTTGLWYDQEEAVYFPYNTLGKRPCDGIEGRAYVHPTSGKRYVLICPIVWGKASNIFDVLDRYRIPTSTNPEDAPKDGIDRWEKVSIPVKMIHELVHALDVTYYPGSHQIGGDRSIKELYYFKGITGREVGMAPPGTDVPYGYPYKTDLLIHNADSITQLIVAHMFPAYYFVNGQAVRIGDSNKWPPMPGLYSLSDELVALNDTDLLNSDENEEVPESEKISENQIVLGDVEL